jgi:hypothetical protein
MAASGEMEQGGAHGAMGEEEGLCGGGGSKKGRWQGSMRFGLDKNGRWTMGCVLTSPAEGVKTFTSKVLRFNGMTDEVRTVLEAHLLEEVAAYTALSSPRAVQAKLHEWVLKMRETNPGFWPKKKATGCTPGYQKAEKGSMLYKERADAMRNAREHGKHWAGRLQKDLAAKGYSRSDALVGKPYIARLLKAHNRCAWG